MADVVLDAGVLIGLENARPEAKVAVEEALTRGGALLVAGATYAEVWRGPRGGRATGLARVLKGCRCVPTTEAIGKRAGELVAKSGGQSSLHLDAIVVATAASRAADVLTTDPHDLKRLGAHAPQVRVIAVG